MSSQSRKSASWFARLGKVFQPDRSAARRKQGQRRLRLESLETRSMLSATVLPSIAGVVYQDLGSGALTANDPRVANVTINLFRDGGDGVFEGKNPGDDTLVGTTTTDANGNYKFTNISTAGTYFIQEVGVPGLVVPSGSGVQEVTVTSADMQGAAQATIDSFATTSQYVSGSLHGGKTGTSSQATTDAIGGHRNLYVQLTTSGGAIDMGANSDWPGMLNFGADAASNGIFWVNWDGNNSNPAVLNPTGLGQIDLTSQGAATGITLAAGADHDTGYIMLKVYTDAGDWSWADVALQNTTDGSLGNSAFVPFSSFQAGGGTGANFAKVGAIQMAINGVNAIDGQVGPIQTAGPMVLAENLANQPQADLSLVKTASTAAVTAGNPLTYTLTTTDLGPANATGVSIIDTLPAGFTYTSANGDTSASISGQTLTLGVGSLAVGATSTITVTGTVASTASGTITNTATVSGNQIDPNTSNNTSSVTTIVNAPIHAQSYTDLKIVKTATPNPVSVGGVLTYTLVVTNNSLVTATDVKVVDMLPAGFSYSSASGDISATPSGNNLTLTLGTLLSEGKDTITIVGTVTSAAANTITNTAIVSADQPDANPVDNTSSVTTTVIRSVPSKFWFIV
jgi:uncharacterized repeat protein (TIGR01451 family)